MEHVAAFFDEVRRHAPKDGPIPDALRALLDREGVYSRSLETHEDCLFVLARVVGKKSLVVHGSGAAFERWEGEIASPGIKVCPLNSANARLLRRTFPFTAPRSLADEASTIGTGDRLGIAGPGQIAAVEAFDAVPVLAQQSSRELALTGGRTFQEVVDCASWAVFERHFTRGYGSDGDHLKSEEEIAAAIDQGARMLTLDASKYINNDVMGMTAGQVRELYLELSPRLRRPYERRYLDRAWEVRDAHGKRHNIEFDDERLARAVLVYHKMIDFAVRVYNDQVRGKSLDFEVSIDETLTPTDPAAHFLVANELIEAGVAVWSLAPRFCGEFQKGIDYIGDVSRFAQEFAVHAALADTFGYKLSIHSGSDKFSVFPIIGDYTGGRVHIKTAGTSWLEAMRVLARCEPALFREMYAYALEHFEETRPYYHVNAEPEDCPREDRLSDGELPALLEQDNPRQILHTSYGVLLQAQSGGRSLFRDRLYAALERNEAEHRQSIAHHLSRHLDRLGFERL